MNHQTIEAYGACTFFQLFWKKKTYYGHFGEKHV
jgi:hypothetical protein